jgi:alkylation response protein AidB-like acyl-CoA dehydrogenase
MTQPQNYGFEEEAGLLKDGARRFFSEKLPVDQLHALVADAYDPNRPPAVKWREDLWREMVDLGWTSLAVPESAGGIGMPWVAVAGLMEENGRAAFPSPLLGHAAGQRGTCRCRRAAREAALADIAAGAAATLAVMDAAGSAAGGGEGGEWTARGRGLFRAGCGQVRALPRARRRTVSVRRCSGCPGTARVCACSRTRSST